jgi:hypothetical protein
VQDYRCIKKNHNHNRKSYLIRISSIPGHNHTPATASSCHGCDMKTFFPLFIYPLERKRFTHFVRLLCVRSSYIIAETSESTYVKVKPLDLLVKKLFRLNHQETEKDSIPIRNMNENFHSTS